MDYKLVFDTKENSFTLTYGTSSSDSTVIASSSYVSWVKDISPLYGTWRLSNSEGVVVDKLVVLSNGTYTYNGSTKFFDFSVDTATFICDDIEYQIKINNGELEVVSPSGLSIGVSSDAKDIESFYGDYTINFVRVDGTNQVVKYRIAEDGCAYLVTLNGDVESLVVVSSYEYDNNILTFTDGSDVYKFCFINSIMRLINVNLDFTFEATIAGFDITKLYGKYSFDAGMTLEIDDTYSSQSKVSYFLSGSTRRRSTTYVQEDNAIIFTISSVKYRVYLDGDSVVADKEVSGTWQRCTLTVTE